MNIFPELVQFKIADYLVPRRDREELIKLKTIDGYQSDKLQGFYAPGQETRLKFKKRRRCKELGRLHSTWTFSTHIASRVGNLRLLKWLHCRGEPLTSLTLSVAAANGHLPCVRWLVARNGPVTTPIAIAAAANGQLATLKFLFHHATEIDLCELLSGAALGGHLCVVWWLLDRIGVDVCVKNFTAAVQGGNLDVIKLLFDDWRHPDLDNYRLVFEALRRGKVANVEWLLARGWRLAATSVADAAPFPKMIRFVVARGLPVTRTALVAAAAYEPATIRWLIDELKCPPDTTTNATLVAAAHGSLDNLKALVAHGCPVDAQVLLHAVRRMHRPVVAYLVSISCPLDAAAMTAAVCTKNFPMMKALREWGCPMDADNVHFARLWGPESHVQWLLAQGCPDPLHQ